MTLTDDGQGNYAYNTDTATTSPGNSFGDTQSGNSVAGTINFSGSNGRYDLHWRGVALGDFDGHAWSNRREQFPLQREPENRFLVPRAGTALLPLGCGGLREVRYLDREAEDYGR